MDALPGNKKKKKKNTWQNPFGLCVAYLFYRLSPQGESFFSAHVVRYNNKKMFGGIL